MKKLKRVLTLAIPTFLLIGLALVLVKPSYAPWLGGCTPGFWKNHLDVWPPPFEFDNTLVEVFVPTGICFDHTAGIQMYFDLNNDGFEDTLEEALNYGGGRGSDGAARILLRAAVASLLNHTHNGIAWYGWQNPDSYDLRNCGLDNYKFNPYDVAPLICAVNDALLSGNRGTMICLAELLDEFNNQFCPLD